MIRSRFAPVTTFGQRFMLAGMVRQLKESHALCQVDSVQEVVGHSGITACGRLAAAAYEALTPLIERCPDVYQPDTFADWPDEWWSELWTVMFPYWVNLRYELFAEHWDLSVLVDGGFVAASAWNDAQSSRPAVEALGDSALAFSRLVIVDVLDSLSELANYQPLAIPDFEILPEERFPALQTDVAPDLLEPWRMMTYKDLGSWLGQVLAEGLPFDSVCPVAPSASTTEVDLAFATTSESMQEGLADQMDRETLAIVQEAADILDAEELAALENEAGDLGSESGDHEAQARWEHQQELILSLTLEGPAVIQEVMDWSVFQPWQKTMIEEAMLWLAGYSMLPSGQGGYALPGFSPIWQGHSHNLAQGLHAQLAALAIASNPQFHPYDAQDQQVRMEWLDALLSKPGPEYGELSRFVHLFAFLGQPVHRLALMSATMEAPHSSSALH